MLSYRNMAVYPPSDDSYLLQKSLIKFLKNKDHSLKILDMCSGSGIQAKTCKDQGFNKITTVDKDQTSVDYLKKQNLNSINSDLFSKIKEKFDLIICNPPYLPKDEREPKDSQLQTTGGKKGYEFTLIFLTQAKKHLTKKGTILLLFSSLSKPKIILEHARKLKLTSKCIAKIKIPFEELFVYKLKKNSNHPKPF